MKMLSVDFLLGFISVRQISAQRCILEVNRYRQTYPESVDAYFEECIVRRELADNFCFYQTNYDNINGAADWARNTLEIHKKDVRPYLYSKKTLEKAKTHDDLWNSAQIQLIKEGKMHGALRMYWAKKILEWTKTPEEALSVAMYLNDRYSLDGRDPSGYVGCMISICGIHDQMSWLERDIFGKIRFMNYEGCKRKYNVKTFVARHGGKAYKNTSNSNKHFSMTSKKRKGGLEGSSKKIKLIDETFVEKLESERNEVARSVTDFSFNKNRVRMLSKQLHIPEKCDGVVYWMSRDQRVQGLQEVESDCQTLNISFHLLLGQAKEVLPKFVKEENMGGVVTDFAPLRLPLQWVKDIENSLPGNVPFGQVDAHNVVPCWVTSSKQEYAARTIRSKINKNLKEFLTKFPAVIKHPHSSKVKYKIGNQLTSCLKLDKTVGPVEWAKPGSKEGLKMLHEFCIKRLKMFANKRNDPNENALSGLSPWIHFGQISAQRCILEVKEYRERFPESVDAYIEECIVRRELADNFCFYQTNYDNINGASDWAKNSLEIHKKDVRTYIYNKKTLDEAKTHDDLWNSAQIQLVKEGKMHGFLRMYWAKKILEWTKTPEEALAIAIYLNDRYNLDGRDPNGYVGCMWSICGIHDQGWAERSIFGKIRYMNYEGCKRKFDVKAFVSRYGGKVYTNTSISQKTREVVLSPFKLF
ncbi:Deoxyribodipyrimidine photo-lyase [Armadillidium nasatum]|uniref:Deoxyribodipyrimidine photo-lyase n=1 Tax=Armadillidium nasatum TaxID=96803 RepID=A0A5N5TC43_9CRUS|nr:Deoxyribodipyrimidine photo-lyase [Armadillidium nasatum]